MLDDGEKKSSLSTVSRVGVATARILERPDQTRNQMLYIQSFCVSQVDIVRAYERATNVEWKVTKYDAEEFKNAEKAKADSGDASSAEELVWYLGYVDADWRKNEGFAMKLLGLEDEDLDAAVEKVIQKFK